MPRPPIVPEIRGRAAQASWSLAAAAIATAALSGQPQSTGSSWDTRVEGAGDYQTVVEVSGRYEMALYRGFGEPDDLASLCEASRVAEREAIADAERQAAELRGAGGGLDLAWAERALGQLYAYRGEMAAAGEHFEASYRILLEQPRDTATTRGAAYVMEQSLGIAHLRRGELENCLHGHNADRCIFPIRGRGIHENRSGSEQALTHLSKAYSRQPGNLEVRWLLNLAYMTLGRYPDDVPREALIPLDRGSSESPRFVDVGHARGLDASALAGGTVVDDFDNDGDLDLVFSSVGPCDPLRLYLNDGGGRFAERSAEARLGDQLGGLNLSHADYDNDGRLDLFVHRGGWESPMRNSLLRNKGDGTFVDVTASAGLLGDRAHRTHTAAWGDYDNDGWLDLFVGNEESRSELYHNQKDGTFKEVGVAAGVGRIAFTKGATWGDYDNDGWLDLYVSNFAGTNVLYRNRGNGTFEDVTGAAGVDRPLMSFPTWFFDYDNDGWLDLFVASFVPSVTEVVRGFLDLPPQAEPMRLYRNTGKGTFENVTALAGLSRVVPAMGANFGDIDNDGFLDIYLGTGAPSYAALVPNVLFRNVAGARFEDATAASGTGHLQKGHGVAFGDVDGDGAQELVVNIGGFVPGDAYWNAMFRAAPTGSGWLRVRLVGAKSNRFGVGARLTAVVREHDGTSREIRRVVTSGGSFGASPYTQHLGLGGARRVERLDVWWPVSGTRQSFEDLEGGQTIEIREGEQKTRQLRRP